MCNGQAKTVSPAGQAHQCACAGHGASLAGRQVEASHDLEFPPVAFPSAALFEAVGEAKLRELVRHHHGLLRNGPLGDLFSSDDADFTRLVERVADFVIEACGGPAAYSPTHGSTCMRTRHFPFSIDERAREIWLDALFRAMEDTAFPEAAREAYWNWLEAFSVRMINRRTMKALPVRVAYRVAVLRFHAPADATGCRGVPAMRLCPRA